MMLGLILLAIMAGSAFYGWDEICRTLQPDLTRKQRRFLAFNGVLVLSAVVSFHAFAELMLS